MKTLFDKDLRSNAGPNLTPVVDIVFLLIIFFMLTCQFIVAENFDVNIPDKATNALQKEDTKQLTATVTITIDENGRIIYAVGSEKFISEDLEATANKITDSLDKIFSNNKTDKSIVTLRVDKKITYAHTQHALAAIANSTATNIQLSAMKIKIN